LAAPFTLLTLGTLGYNADQVMCRPMIQNSAREISNDNIIINNNNNRRF